MSIWFDPRFKGGIENLTFSGNMANHLQNLDASEVKLLFSILEKLSQGQDWDALRIGIADDLLRLLHSDYFASFIWNEDRQVFGNDVFLNMSPENMGRYYSYYQFCDPITPSLQKRRKATLVSEIMPQQELEKTEFFNDFLMADGLHHGIDVYAYEGDLNVGDLRIWRAKHRPSFERREAVLLDTILPHFCNALRNARTLALAKERNEIWERLFEAGDIALFLFDNAGNLVYENGRAQIFKQRFPRGAYPAFLTLICSVAAKDLSRTQWGPFDLSVIDVSAPDQENRYRAVIVRPSTPSTLDKTLLMTRFGLSRREAEISLLICKGLIDQEIARVLGMAFSTVRTHLKNIFRKLDVSTRSELIFIFLEDLVEVSFS